MERAGAGAHHRRVSDLRERTPGHALIERLLVEWERGTIHLGDPDAEPDVELEDGARSWYRGAIGERHVGAILARLTGAWTVLHSVPVGTGSRDIDHVVIGPGGVFTINTKYSPGTDVWAKGMGLFSGGHRRGYVRKARDEAAEAASRLSAAVRRTVRVTGMIVFVEPGRMDVHPPLGDGEIVVKAVRDSALLDSLHSRHPLPAELCARVVDAAVRPETWHEHPEASGRRGEHLALEFEALRRHVRPGHEGPRHPRPGTDRTASALVARPRRPAAGGHPGRPAAARRTTRRRSALVGAIAWLILAAVAVLCGRLWLHDHPIAPPPTPAASVSRTVIP